MRDLKTTSTPMQASPDARRPPFWARLSSWFGAQLHEQIFRWPLLLPLAIVAGAAIYLSAPFEPTWTPLLIIGATTLWVSTNAYIRRVSLLYWIALGLSCASLGATAAKLRVQLLKAPILTEQIGPVQIEGKIAEIDASERSRRIRLDVRAIQGLGPSQTPRYVRFSVRGEPDLAPGRAVSCRAILSPPPSPTIKGDYAFNRDAYFQQLGGVGFSIGECETTFAPPPHSYIERAHFWIDAVRRAIAVHVRSVAGERGGGMAAALVSGDRSFMDPKDSEALRLSGLAHLLAISGLHMVLAGGAFFIAIRMAWPFAEPLALRVPAVKAAALGAIIACTLYFALSGGGIATQRAYIMALIAFGAKLLDKPALSLRSIAIAMAIVVLIQPETVLSPGFQMSFAASAALIAVYEAWPNPGSNHATTTIAKISRWSVATIVTSVTASLATMPFAIHHFDRAAPFGILANLVVSPIVSFWTAPSASLALIAVPFGLQDYAFAVMGQSLAVILSIAHWVVAASPQLPLPPIGGANIALFGTAMAIFCVLRKTGRALALIPLLAALTLWANAKRPIAYLTTNHVLYIGSDESWLEWDKWETENTLRPLALNGDVKKINCKDETICKIQTSHGEFQLLSVDGNYTESPAPLKTTTCATENQILTFRANATEKVLELNLCDEANAPGFALYLNDDGSQVEHWAPQPTRPWNR